MPRPGPGVGPRHRPFPRPPDFLATAVDRRRSKRPPLVNPAPASTTAIPVPPPTGLREWARGLHHRGGWVGTFPPEAFRAEPLSRFRPLGPSLSFKTLSWRVRGLIASRSPPPARLGRFLVNTRVRGPCRDHPVRPCPRPLCPGNRLVEGLVSSLRARVDRSKRKRDRPAVHSICCIPHGPPAFGRPLSESPTAAPLSSRDAAYKCTSFCFVSSPDVPDSLGRKPAPTDRS